MYFNKKRDRLQIISEILNTCRTPQTQTYIRRETNVSYSVLHGCITQLVLRNWLAEVDAKGQRKLAITDKGLIFLEKWFELQQTAGIKKTRKVNILTLKA